MAETHVPGIGNVKKSYVYIAGFGIAAILGIAYWRHQANSAANAAASNTASTTATTDPSIDPSTGLPYSAESGIGSYPSYPFDASNYGGGGYPYNPAPTTNISSSGITDNATWATMAENDLLAMNVDTATAATAISKVLAGLPVTVDQQNLFLEAVGLIGQPPQGYPKPIKLTDTAGHPGGGGNQVTVPEVVGMGFGEAHNVIVRAGLKTSPGAGGTHAAWTVTAQNPAAGKKVSQGSTVHLTVPAPRAVKK